MAYSCVKVLFEIGHEASIRTKRTPEGFTHDWEVFVRGADNSDIFHFVDKVVFYLHETFPKPKRVVKEPPFSVKESGYAGFNLPIDVYFKNSDEPKKVRFNYDLHLQPTGPPISKVLREQYVFPNPAEDLRRRLIKGGGVGVLGSESGFHLAVSEKLPPPASEDGPGHKHVVQTLVGKPKLSGNDSGKKHKVKEGKSDESRVSNSFHDLFGPPIKTAKVSPDPKKSSSHSSPKVSPASKAAKPLDKSSGEKTEKSSKSSKHGSQREGKDSTERSSSSSSSTKEEKKEKDKNRDKEKNKDKAPKRPSTPVKPPSTPPKRPSSPPKRPPSPKRPLSPAKLLAPPAPTKLTTSPKHTSSAKPGKDEAKKTSSEDSKNRSESKSSESNKSEKKKKDKKNRDEKPKKDKHKDHEKGSEKVVKSEKSKDSKDKDANKKLEKETIKEPEKSREKDKEKTKHSEGDKEKQRHKHKKKDKSNKDRDRDKERDKDKSSKKSSENKVVEVRDKDKNGLANESSRGSADTTSDISAPHKKQAASSPSPSPIRMATSPMKPSPTPEKSVSGVPLKDKIKRPLISDDSSDSHSSALSDEDVEPPVSRIKPAKTPESGHVPVENKMSVLPATEPPRPNSRSEILKPKSENTSQERNSLNKSSSKQKEKSSKKNKERESGSGDGEKPEKDSKKNKRKRSNRIVEDIDCSRNNGEAPTKIPKLEIESDELPLEAEQMEEKAAVEEMEIKEESDEAEDPPPPTTSHLTEEYVSQLRELQHKIMTLEDNTELQRVVQVIAETGQYEITKKTFDFDLCALDRSTVERLQEFFAPS